MVQRWMSDSIVSVGLRASVVHVPANGLEVQVTERTGPGFQDGAGLNTEPCVCSLAALCSPSRTLAAASNTTLFVCLLSLCFSPILSFLTPAYRQQETNPGLTRSPAPGRPGKHQGLF